MQSCPHVAHLPGASELQVDRFTAIRAACQVTGPSRDVRQVKTFADQFVRWLGGGYDDTDRAIRRHVLLTVTADLEGTSEREAARIVKLADDLYNYVG